MSERIGAALMTGRRREIKLLTDVFDRMDNDEFERHWVAELIDQISMDEEKLLSLGQLARLLVDVRSRYRLMNRRRFREHKQLNDLQVRIIQRLRGVLSQRELAVIFRVTQPLISNVHRGRTYRGVGTPAAWPGNGSAKLLRD